MTTRAKRLIGALGAAILGFGTLTACTPTEHCHFVSSNASLESPVQVAAVLAPGNNFVDFQSIITASETSVKNDLGGELPSEDIKQALGRELSVILADGSPQLVVKKTVDPQGDSERDIKRAVQSTFTSFGVVAKCAAGEFKVDGDQVAADAETNIIGAMSFAADQFTDENAEHKLYILSNGIQTAGAIEMQTGGNFPKNAKAATLLAKGLYSRGALPDLKGATVYWYGLGQVDGTNQKLLPQKATDSLISFWQQVIAYAGGTLETENIYGKVGTGLPHENAVKVSTVVLKECKSTLYEDDGVEFVAGKSTFVNPARAKAAAKTVVEKFKAGGCEEMTITGFAAAGVDKPDYLEDKADIDTTNKTLTLSRAKKFSALVRSAGFTGEIATEGFGTCGTEWKATGKVDPALQKMCRRVEVSN